MQFPWKENGPPRISSSEQTIIDHSHSRIAECFGKYSCNSPSEIKNFYELDDLIKSLKRHLRDAIALKSMNEDQAKQFFLLAFKSQQENEKRKTGSLTVWSNEILLALMESRDE